MTSGGHFAVSLDAPQSGNVWQEEKRWRPCGPQEKQPHGILPTAVDGLRAVLTTHWLAAAQGSAFKAPATIPADTGAHASAS